MRSLKAYSWLFALMTLSGLLLMLFYVPYVAPAGGAAPASHSLTAGIVARGVHFWGAQIILVAVFVHVARMVFVKASRALTGRAVALALLTILLWLTGTLLPWDQLVFWILHWLRGMSAQNAVLTAYWVHVIVLPVLAVALLIGYVRRFRQQKPA